MQALLLNGVNQPLHLQQTPTPTPGPGEVLVRLHAAALNHRDVWIQKGQYAGLKFPIILGSDGAGTVAELGENTDAALRDQRVLINPGMHWGDNPAAQAKEFQILGLPQDGTFAEYVCVPARYVHSLPAHLSFAQAAALPLGGLTAYRALFTRANLQPGERVLVSGVGGGVALLALQFAVASGAEVWVTSSSEEKINRAKELGAQGGINYQTDHWPATLTKQAGGEFDVIIDSAAGSGFHHLIDAAAPGGRIVFYGATQGDIPEVSARKIFWKQLSVLGSTMGTEQDFAGLLALVSDQKLVPVIDKTFPLAEGEAALRHMDAGAQFGKIVLEIVSA